MSVDGAQLKQLCDSHESTDAANALAFQKVYSSTLRYCHRKKAWYVWEGTRWAEDETGAAYRYALHLLQGMREYARNAGLVGLTTHLHQSMDARALEDMLKLAGNFMGVRLSEFDTNPYELNTLDGLLNLETGELTKTQPYNMVTKTAHVRYDPTARCPNWQKFLREILPDGDVRSYIQRIFGYGMCGAISEQVLIAFYGSGANGKSTLVEVIRAILGDYAKTSEPSLLLRRHGEVLREDIVRLAGSRIVFASESARGKKLDEAVVKRLTGKDGIAARSPYEKTVELLPTWKIILMTNHLPEVDGSDPAIWRRLRVVPFNVRIPLEQQDTFLQERLLAEAPGILNWMLEGFRIWRTFGLGTSDIITKTTEEFQSDMDSVAEYLTNRCEINASATVTIADLHSDYQHWCRQNGFDFLSKNEFGGALKKQGFQSKRVTGFRYWEGLRIKIGIAPISLGGFT